MGMNQKPNTELPLEWDREWYKNNVRPTNDDAEAHYDRGGIVLMTKYVGGDYGPSIVWCYPDGLIEYLEEIQSAGVLFNAKAYLDGIADDIARGGLEKGRALLRLMAYTLSQPSSLAKNIRKHVGIKDQKFLVGENGRGDPPDEVYKLALQIRAPE